ncbi:MAG: cyclopropane fatty acyl phospholipid synthase [Betaproteobacteria bacterium]|nr:cyclopropane fatty acyl phospholipid synthase [Betaproteobacteria bacterium]MDE2622502.1 cyclopropane fatty acyl phospholipid synthase [Betaproteobacteria bacterium]
MPIISDRTAGQIQALLDPAGIRLNGPHSWDPQIHRPDAFYSKVFARWSLGLGESYMDGDWDCEGLDEFFNRVLWARVDQQVPPGLRLKIGLEVLRNRLTNRQSRSRAFQVAEQHYDAGNDLFEAMLDSRMIYSCAYWARAASLEQAQHDKLELICRKLELQPGETLLDIGCGWGGLARYAAENYQVSVLGITVSREQQQLAQVRCQGLPVTIRLCDYRELTGSFHKIVSVGMFEHVGPKNYRTYFDTVLRLLRPEGLFLLHTIGSAAAVPTTDGWIDRYIFPNGHLPALEELTRTLDDELQLEDWHNFGHDYDRTLMAWHERFEAAWPALAPRYGERFGRMWRYYLLCCAGLFRSGEGRLWQLVLSRRGRRAEYRSQR